MADYTELNVGTGGDKIIDDAVGVVTDTQGTTEIRKMPVSKIALGAEDHLEGYVSRANPMPTDCADDIRQIRAYLDELMPFLRAHFKA